MISDRLFGATKIPLLVKGLDAYALRHRAITDNVVNSETDGYKRRQVKFEEKLQTAMNGGKLKRTSAKHLGSGGLRAESISPDLVLDHKPSDVNDLNNVDIDREMGEMAKNHLQFSFASRITKNYFEILEMSIRGM